MAWPSYYLFANKMMVVVEGVCYRPPDKSVYLIFFFNQNISFGYSKEPSQ